SIETNGGDCRALRKRKVHSFGTDGGTGSSDLWLRRPRRSRHHHPVGERARPIPTTHKWLYLLILPSNPDTDRPRKCHGPARVSRSFFSEDACHRSLARCRLAGPAPPLPGAIVRRRATAGSSGESVRLPPSNPSRR